VDVGVKNSTSACYGIHSVTDIIINSGEINVSVQSDGATTGIYGNKMVSVVPTFLMVAMIVLF